MRLKNWPSSKIAFSLFASLFISVNLMAEKKSDPQVIVTNPNGCATEVKVNEGVDTVAGEPSKDSSKAYHSWKKACGKWKSDLKSLNQSNLIFVSCGKATRQNGVDGIVFQSKGSYKVKLGCP